MWRWVSLGGWCGPSLMLSKLGLRPAEESLPFDMVRCTFDGLVELTAKGFSSSLCPPALVNSADPALRLNNAAGATPYNFPAEQEDGYFPQASSTSPVSCTSDAASTSASLRFIPDPVKVWLLFRSQHACFTHYDLNNADVQVELRRRIRAWETLLSLGNAGDADQASVQPVTFIRTVIAENPAEELEMLPRFHQAVRERTHGRLPFRTVLVVHDQADTTRPLCAMPQESKDHHTPCIVWNLRRQRPTPTLSSPPAGGATGATSALAEAPSLLDECHDGYQTILTAMSKNTKWRSLDASLPAYETYVSSRRVPFTPYTELSRVDGVPAVRGTCTGFGSTFSAALGRCVHCGCTDGHAVFAGQYDKHQEWRDEDVNELLLNYALHHCDEVAAVEATALRQKRGAHETWHKLRALLSD
ncbi:hypothetical protein LPMP_301560 [Leishmania panamensis]|uniref:Uncharacterized protein n=1 Tax=Leishmania panamensis TaxID=5679 RepID=A0A088SF01_LEIPA|nr:hypothetical protein LPMP_301560 [Leishmania panamensis]AIO00382.1 hypothetical protein LPMP_301560 [Leishmania panamensis]